MHMQLGLDVWGILVFLELEKAFDSVARTYVQSVLHRIALDSLLDSLFSNQ